MTVQRGVGLQFALVKEILDPKAQKRQVEEKIRAVEEWNNLFLENAARMDIHSYMQNKLQMAVKTTPNRSVSQLSLSFDNDAVSADVNPTLSPRAQQIRGQRELPLSDNFPRLFVIPQPDKTGVS